MQKIINFLNKLEIWFFYGFLVTFTLSIRKVLFFYPIRGQFNEYGGIYLYLSDIFILLMLASWLLLILYNKIELKSRYRLLLFYLKQKLVFLPLLLVVLSFISVSWSNNQNVAIFRSLKLLEFYFLYLWVILKIVSSQQQCSTWNIVQNKRGTILRNSALVVILTGMVQAIVGIWQFIIQKSLGLIWLKESILASDISGVAKVVFNGEKYVRAYGLFPHSNVLGGFLVLSIVLTIVYFKILSSNKNVPRGTSDGKSTERMIGGGKNNCFTLASLQLWRSGWNNYMYILILGVQIMGIILTFSKSAWVGLIVALAYLWYLGVFFQKDGFGSSGMFHVEHLKKRAWNKQEVFLGLAKGKIKYFALIASILILIVVVTKPSWYSMAGKSIDDRMFYLNVSRGTFMENPILGVGSGQFVLSMENIKNLENWQFQPVHNVFLLILNELGIIGLGLFLWFIWEIIKVFPSTQQCSTWNITHDKCGTMGVCAKAIFFGFLFVMLVDHYFWDIQQGEIMLWLVLGIIAGCKVWTSMESDTYPQDKDG